MEQTTNCCQLFWYLPLTSQESFLDWDENMQLECAQSFKKIQMQVRTLSLLDAELIKSGDPHAENVRGLELHAGKRASQRSLVRGVQHGGGRAQFGVSLGGGPAQYLHNVHNEKPTPRQAQKHKDDLDCG